MFRYWLSTIGMGLEQTGVSKTIRSEESSTRGPITVEKLAQSLPLTLSAPPGFDFAAFSTGGTMPPWLAPLERNMLQRRGSLEEIQLNSGPAPLLAEDQKVTILWMVPDRALLLSGTLDRALAIAVANAVQ